jgi:hypothetical protein
MSTMRIGGVILVLMVLVNLGFGQGVVDIPDEGLAAAIRAALGKTDESDPTRRNARRHNFYKWI